jgi:hypothetical protein
MDKFEYRVNLEMDYYILSYTKAPLIGGLGPAHVEAISYVSFRGGWDDMPGIPRCDWYWVPVERAGELFRQSHSSANLRLFIKQLIGYEDTRARAGGSIFWAQVSTAAGDGTPCTIDGRTTLCIQAADNEAAAYCFITKPARTLVGIQDIVISILRKYIENNKVKFYEIYHDGNEWPWLGPLDNPAGAGPSG